MFVDPKERQAKAKQRPRPRVGEVARFTPSIEELLGDVIGACDSYTARLPVNERIDGEALGIVHVIVIADRRDELVVSRGSPRLLAELLRTRYAAIERDEIGIYHLVREPGVRAKVSLYSELADPAYSEHLFGDDGAILKQIVADSGDPVIDMVPAEPEIEIYVGNALAPITVTRVAIGEPENLIVLVIPDEDVGQLDRVQLQLASDLVGWNLHAVRASDHARIGWNSTPIMTASPRARAT